MTVATNLVFPKHEVLERALHKIDRASFFALYGLTQHCTWIERKQNELLELWELCESAEQRSLVIDLLERYRYLTGADVESGCAEVAHTITKVWHCSPKTTLFVAVADDSGPDGSHAVLQRLKNDLPETDGWSSTRFYSQLPQALQIVSAGNRIVLVEDFIGTGSKIATAVRAVKAHLDSQQIGNVSLYVAAIAAMERAAPGLQALGINYHSVHWLKRGISDHYEGAAVEAALGSIKALSSKLSTKHNGQFMQPLGYKKSESLVYIEPVSVPNNVFPIFWWPVLKTGARRRTFFQRQR